MGREELAQKLVDFGFTDMATECQNGTLGEDEARNLLFLSYDTVRSSELIKSRHRRKQQKRLTKAKHSYEVACKAISRLMNEYSAPLAEGTESHNILRNSIQALKRALDLNPEAWGAMWFIGKAYQMLGNDEVSLHWFEKAAEENPAHPAVLREAGIQAAKVGNGKSAEKYTLAALSVRTNDAGLMSNLALALLIQGRVEEARSAVEDAISRDANDEVTQSVLKLVKEVQDGECECPDRVV